ncbi:WHG domain-containing protein [Streptomyces subrutilus]|uniref:WHG domain-containing protein n=1 Tax=Streptomyces subrutilus TaxID=36818 RepID=UPI003F4D2D15
MPGHRAPRDTVGPASRVAVPSSASSRRSPGPRSRRPPLPAALRPEAERMADDRAAGLPPAVTAALVAAWAQVVGLVSAEVFGRFDRVVEDRAAFLAHAADRPAHGVGLPAV